MKNKKQKGMTLIELIAAIAIFSIVSVFLISIVMTALKFNVANKTTFDSNSNSRAFYEGIRQNRPTNTNIYPNDGLYLLYFDNQEELLNNIKNNFNNTMTTTSYTTFEEIKHHSSGKKYAILVDVKKSYKQNPSDPTKKSYYYELTTSSWDLSKDEYTRIDRKSLIAEG